MQRGSNWTIALALMSVSGAAIAQIDYTVNFMAESEKITGSIHLGANSLGPLTPAQITGWTLSSVVGDPVTFSFSSKDAGAFVICSGAPGCGLTASKSALTLIPGVKADIFFDDPSGTIAISTPTVVASGNFPAVLINTPATGLVGFSPAKGTTIATAAPELAPASAAGGLTLLLGSLLVLRGRRASPTSTST